MNSDCSGILLGSAQSTSASCSAWHADLISECNQIGGNDCTNLPGFPLCRNTDDPWIANTYGITTQFEREDETEPPTPDPTAATCEDDIKNGDEEGTDCGGSCPLQCLATCNTLGDCGTSHYLREDPEDIECLTYEYNIDNDLDTCCIARAHCSTI